MKILGNICFILLITCLIVSLFFNLSPRHIGNDWTTVGFSSFLGAINGAPIFDIKWVDKYITVNDLKVIIPILPQSIIDFIDNWLLAPLKLILIIGTTAVNAISVIGYWLIYLFNPFQSV